MPKRKPKGINTSTLFSIPSVSCQCFLLAKLYWKPKEKELQLDVLYAIFIDPSSRHMKQGGKRYRVDWSGRTQLPSTKEFPNQCFIVLLPELSVSLTISALLDVEDDVWNSSQASYLPTVIWLCQSHHSFPDQFTLFHYAPSFINLWVLLWNVSSSRPAFLLLYTTPIAIFLWWYSGWPLWCLHSAGHFYSQWITSSLVSTVLFK